MGPMAHQLHSSQTGRARSQRQVLGTMRRCSPDDEAFVAGCGEEPCRAHPWPDTHLIFEPRFAACRIVPLGYMTDRVHRITEVAGRAGPRVEAVAYCFDWLV